MSAAASIPLSAEAFASNCSRASRSWLAIRRSLSRVWFQDQRIDRQLLELLERIEERRRFFLDFAKRRVLVHRCDRDRLVDRLEERDHLLPLVAIAIDLRADLGLGEVRFLSLVDDLVLVLQIPRRETITGGVGR